MDIRTLSERTGISVRQIRYILDHRLVSDRSWFPDETSVGRARTFDEITGVMIACAAYLLDAGYKRQAAKDQLWNLGRDSTARTGPKLPTIAQVLLTQGPARVQFGDGRYIRWIQGEQAFGWVEPKKQPERIPELKPKVIVELNVAEIRDLVLGLKLTS